MVERGEGRRCAEAEGVHYDVPVTLVHVERSQYTRLRLTDLQQPYWILSYVRQGRVATRTAGPTVIVTSHEVMVHAPYIPFSECADEPGIHEWMMFQAAVQWCQLKGNF